MPETRQGGFNRPRFQGGGAHSQGKGSGGGSQQLWPPEFPYQPGYFFEGGHLKESLLTSFAEKQATEFVKNRLNSSQLRKFYHEVKALEAKIEAGGFDANAPLIKLLRSKVAYACPARGEKKIPDSFAKFLWQHIEQVRSKEDFKAFCTVFEAVVGFFYGKGGR